LEKKSKNLKRALQELQKSTQTKEVAENTIKVERE